MPKPIYEHFTLDIETLSTESNAVVLSLAMVAFDPTGQQPDQIFAERFLDIDEQAKLGRHVSGSTLSWWLGQDRDSRELQVEGQRVYCPQAIWQMAQWIREMTGEGPCGPWLSQKAKIWGNGKDFDVVVLGSLIHQLELEKPWHFRNTRCFRDLYLQHPDVTTELPGLTKHSALDDALWEAAHIKNIVATKGITLY